MVSRASIHKLHPVSFCKKGSIWAHKINQKHTRMNDYERKYKKEMKSNLKRSGMGWNHQLGYPKFDP
jgi:CRISPR/Cas system CMR subunit Cmr6 (Cas7 group RAMP superfamily)